MRKTFAQSFIRAGARTLAACGMGVVAAAAPAPAPPALSLQVADAAQPKIHAPAPQASMQPAMYQPAPIPDPDAGPPVASDGPKQPSLLPSMLSEKRIFEGDGYSYSSSQQGALNHRTQPAAGLNLSVPVDQQVGHAPAGGD